MVKGLKNYLPLLNPFTTKDDLQILLCLTPDDFTRQRETPCIGGERVKQKLSLTAALLKTGHGICAVMKYTSEIHRLSLAIKSVSIY